MQKFMEQTKYKRQMREQLRAVAEINRDPSTALTPTQAKQLLTIVKPWSAKPKMTEEQAKQIMRSVKKVMTARQLNAMSRVRPQRRGGFGGPGGGQGGPGGNGGVRRAGTPGGGPGGPGGQGRAGGGRGFDPSRLAAMKDANFLSTKPDPNNPRSSRRVEANKRFIAMLEGRARGAATTAKR
jgi:hypothetical protein